jgi:PAS domain S-box-containing protein
MQEDIQRVPPSPSDNKVQLLSTELLALLAQKAPSAIVLFDSSTGRLVFGNKTFCTWFDPERKRSPLGVPLQEILGVEFKELFNNRIIPHVLVFGGWEGPGVFRDSYGCELVSRASVTSLRTAAGAEYLGVILTKYEQTQDKIEALTVSDREFLNAVLETVTDTIYFKDSKSRILRASASLARQNGYSSPSQLSGLTDFTLYTNEYAIPSFEDEQKILSTGQPVTDKEEKESYIDGRVRWVSTSKYPLRNRDGKTVGTFGITRDITERKAAEQERKELELQMNLSQKLESIGRLAAGVAHEINTPAQFISDNMQFIKKVLRPVPSLFASYQALRDCVVRGEDTRAALDEIARLEAQTRMDAVMKELPLTVDDVLEGLSRVISIVKSLRDFSHSSSGSKSMFDLNHCVETTGAISRHEWKYVADLELNLAPGLPSVRGNVDEINQVILNLIVNAAQAIDERKKKSGDDTKGRIVVSTASEDGFVVLAVEDNGCGIPAEVQPRLFEPFFTTKDVGKGTGQGLAICRSVVVKEHGGQISFESEPGKGARFIVRLPLPKAELQPENAAT